ncbi:hypothetical protein JCM9279_007108 [Rhodotorula babjevae]
MAQPLPSPTSSTSHAPPAEASLATAEPSQAAGGERALLAASHEQRASAPTAPSSGSAASPSSPSLVAATPTRTHPSADTPPPAPPAPASPEDLARQLASFHVEPRAPPSPIDAAEPPAVEPQEQGVEEEWHLKTISWPPLPPTPLEAGLAGASQQHGFETDDRLRVRVVCQNANGPCSLIAMCNVLILRGDLDIAPGRTSVTYSYLSNLLADYFLRATSSPSSSTASSSGHELSLEAALSILPQTRYGLNLNPRFDRIDGFAAPPPTSSSSSTSSGELALFALARIPLLHGWLADPADPEAYDALVGAAGCQDYDTALERVVEGAEVAGGAGRLDVREEELSDEEMVREAELRSNWTEEQARTVRRAYLINTFLSTTSTQLTYPGLSALCTSPSLLPPSGLAALFRNSHLSVLYRRPTLPSTSSSAAAGPGPELFTLVTDAAFAREEGIVWESLEDVDGAECAFFDAALRRSSVRGGDWVGSGGSGGGRASRDERVRQEGPHDAADVALAQQLQAEEDAHERRLAERSRAEDAARSAARPPPPVAAPLAPLEQSSAPAGRAHGDEAGAPPPPRRGGAEGAGRKLSRRGAGSSEGRKKEEKCVVM